MATCAHCKTEETQLYENNVPICLECSEARSVKRKPCASEQEIRTTLLQDLIGATARNAEAKREFEEAMGQFPGFLPQSDGVQRIKNASREATIARMEMLKAHHRLSDYMNAGIVPEDLKRSAEESGSAEAAGA